MRKVQEYHKVISIVIIILMVMVLFYFLNPVLDRKILPARFIYSDHPGLGNVEGELLFGMLPENQTGTRGLNISNDFEHPVIISIKSSGNISNNLIVSENNFLLAPNETKHIIFTVHTFNLTQHGEYSGELEFITKKA